MLPTCIHACGAETPVRLCLQVSPRFRAGLRPSQGVGWSPFRFVVHKPARMANQNKRDRWLHNIESRQRNIVFPDTLQNETRFWRNLGTGPSKTSTKIGLAVLGMFVFGFAAVILVATFQAGVLPIFILGMLLFCGSLFGAIAWATRRSLRGFNAAKRVPKARKL